MTTALELQHFAVLSFSPLPCGDILRLACTTNNPCHLTCYTTTITPQRHKATRELRGLLVPWGAYWCFDAFTPHAQIEAGDTLEHTFNFPDWPRYQKRWFVFRGTVAGVLSPSASAIFVYTPETDKIWHNGAFDIWPDPLHLPHPWFSDTSGPGQSAITREEIIFDTPPYSAHLQGFGWLQTTYLKQFFCAANFANKTVTFRVKYIRTGQGYVRFYLRIYAISGVNSFVVSNPGGGWKDFSWTGYISSDVTWGEVWLGHFSRHASNWGGFIFDSARFSWPGG